MSEPTDETEELRERVRDLEATVADLAQVVENTAEQVDHLQRELEPPYNVKRARKIGERAGGDN